MLYPTMVRRMFTPCKVLKCEYQNNKGQMKKTFIESDKVFFIAFSNFQGTENIKDGVISIMETASVCMHFNSEIKASDRIKLLEDNSEWDIINSPENWNMQNAFLLFKVLRVKGGV